MGKKFKLDEKIEFVINNWYGKRRGSEQRALNEFVQRHVIDIFIKEIDEVIKEFIKRDEELIVRLQNKEITFDEFLDLRKELIGDKLITKS